MSKSTTRPADPIVFCHVTTWVDSCAIGAEHYYAKLRRRGDQDHELQYRIGQDEADKLNTEDVLGTDAEYRPGEMSGRFFSRDKLCRVAIYRYRRVFPGARLLLLGELAVCKPREILHGPPGVRKSGNAIFRECEALGWWERGNDAKVEVLSGRWRHLLMQHDLEPW